MEKVSKMEVRYTPLEHVASNGCVDCYVASCPFCHEVSLFVRERRVVRGSIIIDWTVEEACHHIKDIYDEIVMYCNGGDEKWK